MFKKLVLTGLCLSSLILVGCGKQDTPTSSNNEIKTVKIWVIAPLSGPAATIGTDAVNAYKFGANEFNKNNQNIQMELVVEDGKCNGKDATSAAQKLVNVDQVKVIFATCSSETLAASKITEPAWLLLLSAVSSSPEISKIKDYTYRYYNDLNQASIMKQYLEKKSLNKVALIYENTDYGIGLANALTNALWSTNIITSQKFNTEEKDFSVIAKQILAQKNTIQSIIYIPNNDSSSINILKALQKEWLLEAFKGKIITSEAGYSSATVKELWTTMEGILTSQLPDANILWQGAVDFIKNFKTTYGEANFAEVFLVLYKESLDLIGRGLIATNWETAKLNDYIKSIWKDNPTNGLFGPYYFDGVDVMWVSFVIKKVQDWKPVLIQQ